MVEKGIRMGVPARCRICGRMFIWVTRVPFYDAVLYGTCRNCMEEGMEKERVVRNEEESAS